MRVLAAALVALALLFVPAIAEAKDEIVVTGSVDVPRGKTVDTIVIADGPVRIAGHVKGDVVSIHGAVTLSGRIDGDLVTITKRARLLPGANVRHDVVYAEKKPQVATGATVGGKIRHERGFESSAVGWVAGVLWWLAVTATALILGILVVGFVPRVVESAWEAADASLGPVIGMGVGIFVGFPLVVIAIAATAVGLPLAGLLLLALLPLYALGYVAAAWLVGRRVLSGRRDRFVPFLVGLLILRLLALVPVLGVLVGIAATVLGLGALGIAAWRAGGAGRGGAPASPAPPAPEAPPATS